MKKTLSAISFIFALTACGSDGQGTPSLGGGGGGTTDLSPSGIWQGTFTRSDNSTGNVIVLIDENNESLWVFPDSPAAAGSCDVAVGGDDFVCAIDGDLTITGTIVEQETLTGDFNAATNATFTVTYNDIYEDNSSLALIEDIWQVSDGGFVKTHTIDSNGSVVGSDTNGCNYSGSFEIIDSNYNMYDYTETVSDCGALNGLYSGKAFVSETTDPDDTLNTVLWNSTLGLIANILTRQ